MKKLINVRYPLIAFLTIVFAILSVVCLVYSQFVWAALAFFILSAFVTLCFATGKRALALVILVSYLFGATVMGVEVWQMDGRKVFIDDKVAVSGYVCDITDADNVVKVVLDDVAITLPDGSTQKLDGKTRLYIYDDNTIVKLGTHVSVIAKVSNVYVFRDTVQALDYCNGIYYKLTSAGDVVYGECKPTLDKACLNYAKDRLQQVVPTNWSLAYALLTGDRSFVSNQTLADFSNTGVMHVFAVSGLHIGFIVAVVGWILGKLGVKRWAKFVALMLPLAFYAYICGFPASVVRALVMTAVSILLQIFWHKTDLLNSASIAGAILFVVNPLNLFNAGFLLSFGAVYGIATVYLALKRLIDQKVKGALLNKLLNALAVSAGATLGTVLISAHYFGSVATLAIVANLVVVPIISLIFVLSAVSLLPFFFGYVGIVADALLDAVKWFSSQVASLPFATVSTPQLGCAILFLLVLMFVLGGYVNVKGKAKVIACLLLCLCLATSCLVANLPQKDDGSVYLADSNQGVLVVASDGEGNYLVVSNCTTLDDVYKVCDRLAQYRVKSLCLAFTNYKSVNVNALQALLDNYQVDTAYVFDSTGNSSADSMMSYYQTNVVVVPPNSAVGKLNATCISDGVPLGLQFSANSCTMVVAYQVSDVLLGCLANKSNADVVYCSQYLPQLANLFADRVVLFGEDTKLGYKNSLTECGNFTICHKSGTIKVTNGWGTVL